MQNVINREKLITLLKLECLIFSIFIVFTMEMDG